MKTKLVTITVFLGGLFLAPFVQAQGSLEGAWQTTEIMITGGDNEGTNTEPEPSLLIFTGTHYSTMRNVGSRPSNTEGEPLTDEQVIAAYRSFRANTGTYEASDSKIMYHVMVARGPTFAGATPEVEYQIEGDKLMTTATNDEGVVTLVTYTRLD